MSDKSLVDQRAYSAIHPFFFSQDRSPGPGLPLRGLNAGSSYRCDLFARPHYGCLRLRLLRSI